MTPPALLPLVSGPCVTPPALLPLVSEPCVPPPALLPLVSEPFVIPPAVLLLVSEPCVTPPALLPLVSEPCVTPPALLPRVSEPCVTPPALLPLVSLLFLENGSASFLHGPKPANNRGGRKRRISHQGGNFYTKIHPLSLSLSAAFLPSKFIGKVVLSQYQYIIL